MTSLPVPVSPRMRTALSTGATMFTTSRTAWNLVLDPIKSETGIVLLLLPLTHLEPAQWLPAGLRRQTVCIGRPRRPGPGLDAGFHHHSGRTRKSRAIQDDRDRRDAVVQGRLSRACARR